MAAQGLQRKSSSLAAHSVQQHLIPPIPESSVSVLLDYVKFLQCAVLCHTPVLCHAVLSFWNACAHFICLEKPCLSIKILPREHPPSGSLCPHPSRFCSVVLANVSPRTHSLIQQADPSRVLCWTVTINSQFPISAPSVCGNRSIPPELLGRAGMWEIQRAVSTWRTAAPQSLGAACSMEAYELGAWKA